MLVAVMMCHALGLALAICLLVFAVLGQAQGVESPANDTYRLEVGYQPDRGQLSVHAEDASLQEITDALARDGNPLPNGARAVILLDLPGHGGAESKYRDLSFPLN